VTIVGLFEDRIDAEDALLEMRRSQEHPDQVSLLIRASSRTGEEDEDATDILARALVTTALDAVGGWLQGLTSVIVPERGTYLVAGPLGAALTGIAVDHETPDHHPDLPAPRRGEAISLLHTFVEFGFGNDEASYLEHRLAAGAVIVALTTSQRGRLQSSRRLFADYNAVHIGQARTDAVLAAEAGALLAAAPEDSQGGDVIVADAVATIHHLCAAVADSPDLRDICGSEVIDPTGRGTGVVHDLVGSDSDSGEPIVRYVVVAFGGLLGLGRHHVAVPQELVDLSVRPVQTRVDRESIHRCPRFDPNGPLSRRLELAICGYFHTRPYWE
jgi:hypothetical protein